MPLMSIMLIIHFGIWAKNQVYPPPPNSRAASPLAAESRHYKIRHCKTMKHFTHRHLNSCSIIVTTIKNKRSPELVCYNSKSVPGNVIIYWGLFCQPTGSIPIRP